MQEEASLLHEYRRILQTPQLQGHETDVNLEDSKVEHFRITDLHRTGGVAVLHRATSSHPQQAGGFLKVKSFVSSLDSQIRIVSSPYTQELPRLWAKCSQAPRAS